MLFNLWFELLRLNESEEFLKMLFYFIFCFFKTAFFTRFFFCCYSSRIILSIKNLPVILFYLNFVICFDAPNVSKFYYFILPHLLLIDRFYYFLNKWNIFNIFVLLFMRKSILIEIKINSDGTTTTSAN